MSAKHGANRKVDLLAGSIVVAVTLLLMVATVYALRQLPGLSGGAPETSAPSVTPPSSTLAPNPYGPGDFALDENGYLSCLAGEAWLGVDVSEHQGSIRWDKVAATDVCFAMVRLAYRGWGSEGKIRADSRWQENLNGAAEAGLQVGVYFFSQAISVEEAREEARFLLALLDGRELDLPVVFDWETVSSEEARTKDMTAATLNACALAFCEEIRNAGYEAMVYFNQDLARRMFDLMALQRQDLDFWLAMYTENMTWAYRVRMWQYTNTASVAGIKGNVDLNLYFPDA